MKEYGTKPRTEIVAGLTMYSSMAYIIPVNMIILSLAGVPPGAVVLATCIASAAGTAVMALWANLPYGMAPGMGLNAFFTFTIVFALGFTWAQALAMVFLCGVVDLIVTATGIRKHVVASIPRALRTAMGVGIGLFIAYIGIKGAGLLRFTSDPGHWIEVGDPEAPTIIADSSAVPAMVPIDSKVLIFAVLAILLTIILYVYKIKGAILIAIIISTAAGAVAGMVKIDWAGYFGSMGEAFGQLGDVFGQSVTAIPSLFSDTSKVILVLATIFALSLTLLFDELGTSLGLGLSSGLFDEKEIDEVAQTSGFRTRFAKSLVPPSVATMFGSLFGTSPTTTYIESSTGIAAGGRTGATALTTSGCFLASIVLAPLAMAVPAWATAPALIVVGVLMMSRIADIEWDSQDALEETIPAFLTIAIMPFAYSITTGIAVGLVFYCLIKIARGKVRQIHPVMIVMTILFLAYFVNMALNG